MRLIKESRDVRKTFSYVKKPEGIGGSIMLWSMSRMLKKALNVKPSGIDYSELSVEKSIKYNRKAINKGQCEIKQGSVSAIPYTGLVQ